MIRFEVPGQPLPAERPRRVQRGRGFAWITPDRTLEAEARVAIALQTQVPGHRVDATSAWAVEARFYRETMATADVDNLLKVVLDGIQGTLVVNDAQVSDLHGIRYLGVGKGQGRTVVTACVIGPFPEARAQ